MCSFQRYFGALNNKLVVYLYDLQISPHSPHCHDIHAISANSALLRSDPVHQGQRVKLKFTPVEDCRLAEAVLRGGCSSWADVARRIPGRNARQCRERWMNYVNPQLCHTPMTPGEDALLRIKYREFGPRWKLLATFFPGRGRNFIKNHWMTIHRHVGAKARRQKEVMMTMEPEPEPEPVQPFVSIDQSEIPE